MSNIKRILILIALTTCMLFMSMVRALATDTITEDAGNSAVLNPSAVLQYGPGGALAIVVLTGILMIVKAVNEGRSTSVQLYKDRAADAEARSDSDIADLRDEIAGLRKDITSLITDRDDIRKSLEDRKTHYTEQILSMEKRHQREIEDQHSALMIEVHIRHKLERILAEKGIDVPETPPPYTQRMKEAVTPKDREAAIDAVVHMHNDDTQPD